MDFVYIIIAIGVIIAFLYLTILVFAIVSPSDLEGHICRRRNWIISGIFFTGLMGGYAVAVAKQNRKIGYLAFIFIGSAGDIYLPLYWLVGGYLIYWSWRKIPEQRKDYSFWWDKNKTAK